MKCQLIVCCLLLTATGWIPAADGQDTLLPMERVSGIRESIPSARAREAAVLHDLLASRDRIGSSAAGVAKPVSPKSTMGSPKYRRVPYPAYRSRFYGSTRSPYGWYRPGVPSPWAVFQLPEPPRIGSVYRGIKHPSQWPGR